MEGTIQMKKKSYNIELTTIGNDAGSVIKTFRDMIGLGLKEAKNKVDAAPCVLLETTSMEEAKRYKTALEKCGATVNISSSTTDILSQKANFSNKLKKIGIDFIILNFIVVFGGASVIAGIPHILIEMDFFSVFMVVAVMFATICTIFNFSNNTFTDHMVAKTVKKNAAKYNFDKAYTFYTNNATVMIDTVGGRIAYISNLNPWEFQMISAKDITDIKNDYKKGVFFDTTHYVYFQFSYQGRVMKIPTFTSKRYRPLTMDKVQEGLKNAAAYSEILRAAKQAAICKDAKM